MIRFKKDCFSFLFIAQVVSYQSKVIVEVKNVCLAQTILTSTVFYKDFKGFLGRFFIFIPTLLRIGEAPSRTAP
jgi:hypothetical protein